MFGSCGFHSNWVWTSCQSHGVFPERSDTVISKRIFKKLFSYIYNLPQAKICKISPYTNSIHYIHAQMSNTNFRRTLFSVMPLLKSIIISLRLRHTGIVDHPVWFIDTRSKEGECVCVCVCVCVRACVRASKRASVRACVCLMIWMPNGDKTLPYTSKLDGRTIYQLLSPSCSTNVLPKSLVLLTQKAE